MDNTFIIFSLGDGLYSNFTTGLIQLYVVESSVFEVRSNGLFVHDLTQLTIPDYPEPVISETYTLEAGTVIYEEPDKNSLILSSIKITGEYEIVEIYEFDDITWGRMMDNGWVVLPELEPTPDPDPEPETTEDDTSSDDTNTISPLSLNRNLLNSTTLMSTSNEGEVTSTGVIKIPPNAACTGLYYVQIPAGTMMYKIDSNNNVTEAGAFSQENSRYQYTIVEEKTIDGKVYAKKKTGEEWVIIDNAEEGSVDDTIVLKGIDNWTIVEYDSPTTIKTNPDVVQHIYSMESHRVIARNETNVSTHTTVVKTKNDVLTELNWMFTGGSNVTYPLQKGDLMSFTTYDDYAPPSYDLNSEEFVELGLTETCENLERLPTEHAKVNAMFVIEDIEYTDDKLFQFPIVDIKLRCFWTDGTIGEFGKLLDEFANN